MNTLNKVLMANLIGTFAMTDVDASVRSLDIERPKPPIVESNSEDWFMHCAAGAIESKKFTPKLLILQTPNNSGVKGGVLPDFATASLVKAGLDLGLEPYSQELNSPSLDQFDLIVQGEISFLDKAISIEKHKEDIGIAGGKGNGSFFLGIPETTEASSGWVTATVILHKPNISHDKDGKPIIMNRAVASHSARAFFYTLGGSSSTEVAFLVSYGDTKTVEKQSGIARASIGALKAALAGSIMRGIGFDPKICKI